MIDLIAAYRVDMGRRGLQPTSIDKKVRYLRLFESEVGLEVEREVIESWLDRYPVAKTRATVLSHLSCFFRWLVEEEMRPTDPTAKIKAPRVPQKLPRPIPDEALEKALANATPMFRVWLLLGAYGGLRCKEIAGLDREDLIPGYLRVTSKGGNEDLVPLHDDVLEALHRYGLPASGPLFRQRSGSRMTPGDVSHRMGDFLRSLGITSTPHSLRHWFGTETLRATHDVRVTQGLLRHKNISSTQIYTAFDQELGRATVAGLGVGR